MQQNRMTRKIIAMACVALLLCAPLQISSVHAHDYPDESCIVCDFINFFETSFSYVTADDNGIPPTSSITDVLSVEKPDFVVVTGNLVLEKVLLLN